MIPPAPSRMCSVCAATCAMSTAVADDAMDAMLWCSAYQILRNPSCSACRARTTVASRLSRTVCCSPTIARSRMDRGGVISRPNGRRATCISPWPRGVGHRRHHALRRAGCHDAGFVREHDELRSVPGVELRQQPADVRLRGRVRHEEVLTDLRIRQSTGNRSQDLPLAIRERIQAWMPLDRCRREILHELLDEPAGDLWR